MLPNQISLLSFLSASCQIRFYTDDKKEILFCRFGDLQAAGTKEFLDAVSTMGDQMKKYQIGKMCMDISTMSHFDIATRIEIIKNLKRIFLDKIPYLTLAVVRGKSIFENMTMQLAINASKQLSDKFRASKMFDSETDAIRWLETQ